MKLTKSYIKRVIAEELSRLNEEEIDEAAPGLEQNRQYAVILNRWRERMNRSTKNTLKVFPTLKEAQKFKEGFKKGEIQTNFGHYIEKTDVITIEARPIIKPEPFEPTDRERMYGVSSPKEQEKFRLHMRGLDTEPGGRYTTGG